jgi:hypothetical protein
VPQPSQRVALKLKPDALDALAGEYVFSPFVKVRVTVDGAKLMAQATGARAAFAIGREKAVELVPLSPSKFTVFGRYPLVLDFSKAGTLMMNPGHWQQTGKKTSP